MIARVPAGTLRLEHAGTQVRLQGWVQRRRDLGALVFVDVRDRSGMVQVVAAPERAAIGEAEREALGRAATELRSEFVVEIVGQVAERSADTVNAKLPTGEVEVIAESIEILARAATPPFQIDDAAGAGAGEDLRLKYRYLDLRRPSMTRNLILRSQVTHAVRAYLHERGYLEIETPILTKSTPEGARDFLVPSRMSRGEFYALPQSPQLFKQLLMVSGLERYYQIARCFRDEDLRADRQPEFTQVDIEASFVTEEDVIELIEGMFAVVFPMAGIAAAPPFPRLTWNESMSRYGSDRPDTRFALTLVDLAELCRESRFESLREPAHSGRVAGIRLPGGAAASRSRLDTLTDTAKLFGARGLLWLKRTAEGIASPVSKHLEPEVAERLADALELATGDLGLIVAGDPGVVAAALGNLRLRLAAEEKLIPDDRYDFLWVTDFPLVEHDAAAGRYVACHHPFTAPQAGADLAADPAGARARAYDIVLNGLELGGGSIRINRPELQEQMFGLLGIGPEEARAKFGFLLDAFRYGAPPHGGIALGVDRMLMVMSRSASIRDVIAFPKTASGLCLMTQSPSPVAPDQLAELGLRAATPRQ